MTHVMCNIIPQGETVTLASSASLDAITAPSQSVTLYGPTPENYNVTQTAVDKDWVDEKLPVVQQQDGSYTATLACTAGWTISYSDSNSGAWPAAEAKMDVDLFLPSHSIPRPNYSPTATHHDPAGGAPSWRSGRPAPWKESTRSIVRDRPRSGCHGD